MNAQDIVLGQLERERSAHNITRETLRALEIERLLRHRRELKLPWWKRKLLAWLRKGVM